MSDHTSSSSSSLSVPMAHLLGQVSPSVPDSDAHRSCSQCRLCFCLSPFPSCSPSSSHGAMIQVQPSETGHQEHACTVGASVTDPLVTPGTKVPERTAGPDSWHIFLAVPALLKVEFQDVGRSMGALGRSSLTLNSTQYPSLS